MGNTLYTGTIWKYTDDETFDKACYLESGVPTMRFVKDKAGFFVGLGKNIGDYRPEKDAMGLGEILHITKQQ